MAYKRKTVPVNALMSLDKIERIDFVIRQTGEKVTALFYKVHNLQIELAKTNECLRQTSELMLRILDDPESRQYAEAVLKDYKFNKANPR